MSSVAEELAAIYGPDPSLVGAADGSEDDWGDLLVDAATRLGVDLEDVEAWEHFQAVAIECRATTMDAWLAHLEAAVAR
jgi:hypothetical protein